MSTTTTAPFARFMKRQIFAWMLLGSPMVVAGCAPEGDYDELTAVTSAITPVNGTGNINISVTTGSQSETAATGDSANNMYFAYNGSDDAHITYPTATSRRVCRGATQMRYSL